MRCRRRRGRWECVRTFDRLELPKNPLARVYRREESADIAEQRFHFPEDEEAPGSEYAVEFAQQGFLRVTLKIDDDVAAENEVNRIERRRRLEEIRLLERHQTLHVGKHRSLAIFRPEVARAKRLRCFSDRRVRIQCALSVA